MARKSHQQFIATLTVQVTFNDGVMYKEVKQTIAGIKDTVSCEDLSDAGYVVKVIKVELEKRVTY